MKYRKVFAKSKTPETDSFSVKYVRLKKKNSLNCEPVYVNENNLNLSSVII